MDEMKSVEESIKPVLEYMEKMGVTMESDPRLIALAAYNVGIAEGNDFVRESIKTLKREAG